MTLDPGDVLSDGALAALAAMEERGGEPFENLPAHEARRSYENGWTVLQSPPSGGAPEKISIPLASGGLPALLHRGRNAPKTGARLLLYIHGGGWVVGSPRSHAAICSRLADAADAVVICPDYPLAPEARFPAAPDTLAECLRRLPDLAADFGASPDRIAAGGDSAGGNLSSVLALTAAQDASLPRLRVQLLFYPNTDARQDRDSFRRYATGFGLTAATMAWFRDCYIASPEQIDDWRVSPVLADIAPFASRIAPAFVALAGADILFDEGAAYADKLAAAGVPVTRRDWPRELHGFLSFCKFCPPAREAVAAAAEVWRALDP